MTSTLDQTGRDLLFLQARTANRFLERPVAPDLLREIYDLMKWGPTSMNCCPVRIAFLTTSALEKKSAFPWPLFSP